ncbi:uncharacterized protein LOC132954475 [Labrus mixtus]|uniref:uncharacterized protein LOC132954475 n=1 Tax=Labrus mixtus TaxID=508554 RepID=UPI0029BFC89B|nr:uncharacterized protein LOC132954475 [Labrus mixtus]
MHLKQTGYCVGFLLVYTFITMISLTGGRCAAHFSQPQSHLAFHDDESNDLTARGLRKLLSFNSRQKEEKNRDVTETESARRRRTFKPTMSNKSSRKRDTVQRTEGRWRFSSSEPPHEGCSEGNIQTTTRGKFTITGQLEANIPNTGYQSDSAVSFQSQVVQQRVKGHQMSWLSLQPEVECGEEAMTLTVRRRRAAQLLLDRDNESPVPLTQLPPQCGYSVQASWKDLRLMAQYNACHVIQEDDHFVLPLLWRGTPVRVSCPSPQMEPEAAAPSSLCCSPYSLTVKLQGVTDTWELRVDVRGEWTPLVTLVEQCGYTVERHDAEVIITAPYVTCGITVKDGKHTISLQIRGKTFTLACPVSPTLTPQQAEPWAPPFYLAPPFYPHPRYHHTYPPHGARNPPTPEPTLSPQAPPPDDHQALYSDTPPLRDYYNRFGVHVSPPAADREEDSDKEDSDKEHPDLQQEQEKQPEMHPAARSASSETPQAEAPPMQQHAFSQYYHYFHHPKIPLTGQPKVPDPGPEVPKQPSDHNLSLSVELSEAPSSPSPPPGSPEFTHKTPEHETAHPPLPPPPYPDHYFYYFPQTDRGEAEKSSLLNPKIDDQNSESGIFPADNLKVDDLDPRTIDLDLQSDDLDPRTIDLDLQSDDLDPRTIDLDLQSDDLDPRTIDLDLQSDDLTDDLDPQTIDLDLQSDDLDPQTDDLDLQTDDFTPQTIDLDLQTDDLTDDLDPQNDDLDPQTDDLDPQTDDLDPQTDDLDLQTDDLTPQTIDLDLQTDDLDLQTDDLDLQTNDLTPQTIDLDDLTDDLDPRTIDLDPQTDDLTDDLDPRTDDLDPQTDDLADKLDPQTDKSHSDEIINFGNKRAERSKTPLLPAEEYDVKEVEVAPDPRSYPATSSSSSHHPPFYPFYLHSDYFNHSYSGAESSLSDHDRESPASSEQDLAPLLQATSSPPHRLPCQTPTPPTEPMHDVQKVHPHPYYSNHHLYDQLGVSADDQEHHPAGSLPPSHSDYSGMDRLFPRAQAGSPSMHQQLRTLYSHYINQQHPDEEDEGQDGEIKDPFEVDSYAPSTSPCGHMSYIDCLYSELLKTYCSWRPYVIFMVPDFAMEHTAASPGDPSEVVDQTGEHLFEAHDA